MKKIIAKRILLCLMISIIVGSIIIIGKDVFNANQIKQSILFEYNYNNGATWYRDEGWYIDNSGNVVLYSFSYDELYAKLRENYNHSDCLSNMFVYHFCYCCQGVDSIV